MRIEQYLETRSRVNALPSEIGVLGINRMQEFGFKMLFVLPS